jgi:hypothetical protein
MRFGLGDQVPPLEYQKSAGIARLFRRPVMFISDIPSGVQQYMRFLLTGSARLLALLSWHPMRVNW